MSFFHLALVGLTFSAFIYASRYRMLPWRGSDMTWKSAGGQTGRQKTRYLFTNKYFLYSTLHSEYIYQISFRNLCILHSFKSNKSVTGINTLLQITLRCYADAKLSISKVIPEFSCLNPPSPMHHTCYMKQYTA